VAKLEEAAERPGQLLSWVLCTLKRQPPGVINPPSRAAERRGVEFGAWYEGKLAPLRKADQIPVRRPPKPKPAAPVKVAKPNMLADRPIASDAEDRLDYKPYADALASLIDNPQTATPLTLAIHAPWGAGKTSLARLVEKRLTGGPAAGGAEPHVTMWFNPWMHEDAPSLRGAFVAEVAQQAGRKRRLWRRLLFPLPAGLRSPSQQLRVRLMQGALLLSVALLVGLAAVGLGLATAPDWTPPAWIPKVGPDLVVAALVVSATGFGLRLVGAVGGAIASFVRDPKAESATGSIPGVRAQLGKLLRQATPRGSRFVVFIDDMERCSPPRAVELLEAISQLVDHPDVVVVLVADMEGVAAHAELKYADLARQQKRDDFGRPYLEKIVQVQFDVPAPAVGRVRAALEGVTAQERQPSDGPWRRVRRILAETMEGLRATPRLFSRFNLWRTLRDAWPSLLAAALLGYVLLHPGLMGILPIPGGQVVAWIGLGLVCLLLLVVEWQRTLRGVRITQLRGQIEDASAGGADAPTVARGYEETLRHLEGQAADLRLANASDFVTQARDEALSRVPALPRHAKRVENRVRLLAVIAKRRGILDGEGALQARQLGKWVALQERWPDRARRIAEDPGWLAREETAAREQPAKGDDWSAFLRDEPALGPASAMLTRFERA
jgi:hypothetical protein